MRAAVIAMFLAGCWSDSQPKQAAPPQPEASAEAEPTQAEVKDIVQPVRVEKQEEMAGDEDVEGGVWGGTINPPPPPPPPPPSAPSIVAPTLLEGSRVAGTVQIAPDDADKTAMARIGKDRLVGSVKLCVDATGAVSSVTLIKSTNLASYDAKILDTIRTTWRYSPFIVNGVPTNVCTAVTFIYSQKIAAPPPRHP